MLQNKYLYWSYELKQMVLPNYISNCNLWVSELPFYTPCFGLSEREKCLPYFNIFNGLNEAIKKFSPL